MPHVPIFASERFRGSSSQGLYGDVIQEIDWSVGQIVKAVDEQGLARKTLIIFFSDNGPFLSYGEHAGHAEPLREGKLTTFEGGFRSPCIMRGRARSQPVPVCYEMVSSMDLLPTLAQLVDFDMPQDRPIDGRDIWPLIAAYRRRRVRMKPSISMQARNCRPCAVATTSSISPIVISPLRPNRGAVAIPPTTATQAHVDHLQWSGRHCQPARISGGRDAQGPLSSMKRSRGDHEPPCSTSGNRCAF